MITAVYATAPRETGNSQVYHASCPRALDVILNLMKSPL